MSRYEGISSVMVSCSLFSRTSGDLRCLRVRVVLTLLGLAALLLLSSPALAGDDPVSSTVCEECHDTKAATLDRGPHQVGPKSASHVACIDCHPGSSDHWEVDPSEHPLDNPSTVPAHETAQICSGCHLELHQQFMAEGDQHADSGIRCTGCHTIHGARSPGLLKKPQPELCLDCHEEVRREFRLPDHHPVLEGVMVCSECRLLHYQRPDRFSLFETNSACVSCHGEFRGPFPYEHQAMVDYSTESGSCLNCHEPHGAAVPRLLRQPLEPPVFPLCSSCHYVPGHNFNSNHGSAFAGVSCTECHVDIHGSYTNRLFFTPALVAQGCLAVGCHHP